MASGTLPELYKFRDIPKEGGRKFCDGGILSNTPFRELLQAHRDYWTKKVPDDDQPKIPDLDVYIVNVHPSKQHTVPAEDRDSVKDRINDIPYSDRNSHYDEMVADLATAYTELIYNLKELAKRHFYVKRDISLLSNLQRFGRKEGECHRMGKCEQSQESHSDSNRILQESKTGAYMKLTELFLVSF